MRSVSSNSFSKIPSVQIQRSVFDRSSALKTAFDSGLLVPVFVDEALPGDTMNCRMTTYARLATPIVPFLDNLHLESHFFAVPLRLLWTNWQRFNGEQDNPGDSTDFLCPQVQFEGPGVGAESMGDYFGLPTQAPWIAVSAFPFRAALMCWNEWFRDENLQDSLPVPTDDGPDDPDLYPMLKRGKRKDYFTGALPWPQKGDSVSLPLGISAPVVSAGDGIPHFQGGGTGFPASLKYDGTTDVQWQGTTDVGEAEWQATALETDLTAATAATVAQLREAFQIQKMYERDARGGSRYTELLLSHFGVTSPDQRLQRPEYLGGGSQNISITPVPQTSSTDGTSPQGNLAGYGVSTGSGHSWTKSFTEHCIVIGFVSVRADLNYQQGLNRMWRRRTRWDYYWPSFAHLGEQAIRNEEIYCIGDAGGSPEDGDDFLTFGYQERYAEYRYKPSMITGKMRSNHAQSLDYWHLAQDFGSLPTLGDTFIQDTPPVDRVIATTNEPELLFDAVFKLTHARPLPTFGTPGQMDRF